MNILYIACSCSPDYGSEDAIGWNIPLESVRKGNSVTVIVRSGLKKSIMGWIEKHPNDVFPEFYFIETSLLLDKIAKRSLYTLRLYEFASKALRLAEELNRKKKYDIIHQITPVEFRSIGNYGKIPNVKFVVGPIAGGQKIKPALWNYVYNRKIEQLRILVNNITILNPSYRRKIKKADAILFANEETRDYFKKNNLATGEEILLPEIGVSKPEEDQGNNDKVSIPIFLMVGRLIPIKGFDIVLDALKYIEEGDFKIRICGDGELYETLEKRINNENLSEVVELVGFVDYHKMKEEYKNATALIMPSLREATGTVLVEAMLQGIPVITFDQFGAHLILDEESGWTVSVEETTEACVLGIANAMKEVINDAITAKRKGVCAANRILRYTWNKKFKVYESVYKNVLEHGMGEER